MRRVNLLLAAAAAAAAALTAPAPAFGGDEVMANYFGNTVVAKAGLGKGVMHYRPDHTFDGKASFALGSMTFKGVWRIDERGQLCRTFEKPAPGMANPMCAPWEAHKVGDVWIANGRRVTLVEGVQ